MSTVAKRGEDFGMPSKERATGPESQVLDDRPEIVPSSSLALLEPAKVANGSKGQVSKARASSVAKPADTIHGDSDSDDDMPTKAQHPAGTVSEPAQASKKPRKKAATFDDQARTRFLRYRIEKRKEHARWLETTALKDVFDRLAPDFCGTRYPEYSYTGGELQNLERSLRRTFTAYRDKGYDSDRTLRLQGKAPPKDDLWELMKQFFGTEDGKETTSKTGTVPLRARRRPSEDSEPDFAPRAVSPYILEVRSRKTRAASFDSVDLEIRQQPTEAELAVQTEEEVVDESDEETRWAIRRGEIVDESDDESRYRIRNDYQVSSKIIDNILFATNSSFFSWHRKSDSGILSSELLALERKTQDRSTLLLETLFPRNGSNRSLLQLAYHVKRKRTTLLLARIRTRTRRRTTPKRDGNRSRLTRAKKRRRKCRWNQRCV